MITSKYFNIGKVVVTHVIYSRVIFSHHILWKKNGYILVSDEETEQG